MDFVNPKTFSTRISAPGNNLCISPFVNKYQSGEVFFTQIRLLSLSIGIKAHLGSQPKNGSHVWLSIRNHLFGVCTKYCFAKRRISDANSACLDFACLLNDVPGIMRHSSAFGIVTCSITDEQKTISKNWSSNGSWPDSGIWTGVKPKRLATSSTCAPISAT